MPELPTGTVTLLFTDVENSTQLVKQLGGMPPRWPSTVLEEVDLGDLSIKDVGKPTARRSGRPVRAYELVYPR